MEELDSAPVGFAFDIDGVLYKHTAGVGYVLLPGARESLALLEQQQIPHVFLSNSTGKSEAERAAVLSSLLGVHVPSSKVVLAATPMREVGPRYANSHVLAVALTEESSAQLAAEYGLRNFTTLQRYPYLCAPRPIAELSILSLVPLSW
eukprot:m.108243 g.108243  ORF g.108243 m.108243 type:complete len:149 (-) comp9002_c0_seq7:2013-2459(-)